VLGCVCCLMAFVTCVVGFVGDVGSSDGKMWLSGGAGLCVVCFAGFVLVCVLSLLLSLVSGRCIRRGDFRRMPALRSAVVAGGIFGGVAWLLGLGCLGGGVGEVVSLTSCAMVRFRLRWVGGVGVELLRVVSEFLGCVGFVGVVGGLRVMCVSVGVEVWRSRSACLPPGIFWMTDLVCGVGVNCTLHIWWGQGFVIVGGSHSWHVHPSIRMSWFIGVGWGRQCACIHLRHRSHCRRSGSLESPSPWWH
jgi:hypothetical protein